MFLIAILEIFQSTKASIGSNIGVQIIGKPFKEEMVLRIMNELFNKVDAS